MQNFKTVARVIRRQIIDENLSWISEKKNFLNLKRILRGIHGIYLRFLLRFGRFSEIWRRFILEFEDNCFSSFIRSPRGKCREFGENRSTNSERTLRGIQREFIVEIWSIPHGIRFK